MNQLEEGSRRARARAGDVLNKLELAYLATIRAIALIIATFLVFYALWLAVSGTYKTSKDVSSVSEAPAAVSPEEVIKIDLDKAAKAPSDANVDPFKAQRAYYADFARRYHKLFTAKFEAFKKAEDGALDQKSFDARYLSTADRIKGVADGGIDFQKDRDDLESLLTTMTAASSNATTIQRLQAYRAAKKNAVTKTISGAREETYCSYYGYYVNECLSYGTQTVPYTRTVQEMKLPAGVISHTDLFGAYQDQYLSTLAAKRRANASAARHERDAIISENIDGAVRLRTAFQVVGGFVIIMFLFLLIALERHQRKIAAATPSNDA